jgi:hypothetical protein
MHFFKNAPKSWFKPISSRDSSFSSCESRKLFLIYMKNHYFHQVMAITTQSPFFLHFDAIF